MLVLPEFLRHAAFAEIVLTGHRIGLYHLVQDYNDGYSPEMLAEQFPTLPLSLVHKVIAFYLENQEEVDRYVARVEQELERQRANGRHLDVRALRERLEAKRQAAGTGSDSKV